jgi:hypothetical protein
MFNNELWQKPAGGGGSDFYTHQIAKSVRVPATSSTSSSNGRLTRTFGTVDSSVHWTLNFWIKRSAIEGSNPVSSARPLTWFTPRNGTSGSVLQEFKFCSPTNGGTAGDALMIVNTNSNAIVLSTNNLFRDTSAWYNIHIQADLDNGSASERLKFFINGTEASYNTDNRSSYTSLPGITAGAWTIGDYYNYGYPIQSYFAQWAYVDGYTHPPTDFGESKNGVWIPKDLSSGITWGNAGHLLDFADASALGNDISGNNNDWSTANIDTHDSMKDSPTFGSSSSGNFATIGRLEKNTGGFTFSEGNLKYAVGTNQRGFITSTGVPDSGKYYWEVRVTQFGGAQDDVYPGVCVPDIMRSNLTGDRGGASVSGAGGYTVNLYNGAAVLNGVFQSNDAIGNKRAVPQTVGIAIDRDNNTLKWTYDGSTYSSTYAIPSSGVLAPYLGSGGGSNTASGVFNFGADSTFAGLVSAGGNADENGFGDFSLAVPTGYLALCSGNQPIDATVDPAQTDDNFAKKLFGTWKYTGNNGARTISTIGENGFGIQQDLHIMRSDTYAQTPYWMNTTEGIFGASSNNYYIGSDGTSAQATLPQYNFVSQSGTNYNITGGTWFNSGSTPMVGIGWRFNGGTTVSNGNGDLTSTVQLDSSTCASIVTYTGTLSSVGVQTVGHGLSKAPNYIITKGLGKAGNWWVWSDSQTSWNYGMNLNNSNVSVDKSGNGSMSAPTSTVFSTNYTDGINDGAGYKMIAYCFANCPGYIQSGEYVGNGNTDGAFVYTGFKPAFVMVKYIGNNHSGAAGESWSYSNANSSPINPVQKRLSMNSSNAQSDSSTFELDYLSNGFKMRTTWEGYNGNNYIISYIAFAENSNKYATAR